MSDLIDREEVIKALRLEYPMMPLFKENQKEWAIKTEGYRKAEEVIMRLPGEVIFESIPSADAPTTMTGVIDAIREAEYRGYMKAVEERPKGEWKWNKNGMDWGIGCWCCSECGMRNPYIGSGNTALLSNPHNWAGSKYCPNCGADMRGESDG